MKIKDIIKKQTTIIAIAVVLVTLALIGVSYAIFFNVNKNTEDQVITAGNLELTISEFTALTLKEPATEEDALGTNSTNKVTYTVENKDSNLPATYKIYIYGGSDNTIPLSSIKISTDGTSSKVLTSITDTINENNTTYYLVDSGTLAAGASLTTSKNLYVWLDEELVADEIAGQQLNLQLYVVSEVDEENA